MRTGPIPSTGDSGIGRRATASLIVVAASASAQGSLDRATFLAASSFVTGLNADRLGGLADPLLAAFQPQAAALSRIADMAGQNAPPTALRGTPLEPVARALAAAWFTGMLGAGASARLVSYEDALVWNAIGMEAAPGQCGGEFGQWAEPPAPT